MPDHSLPAPPIAEVRRSQLATYRVLRRNPLELWGAAAYREPFIAGRFLTRRQVLVNDPDAIRHVLVDNAGNYGRSNASQRVLRPVLGTGLLMAEGAAWRHQRRTIAPSLAPRSMPLLARHIVAAAQAKEDELATLVGQPVELLPHLHALALAIAGQSMFSVETAGFGAELRTLLLHYANRYAQPGVLDLLLPTHIPSVTDFGRAAFRRRWIALIDRVIAQRGRDPAPETPRDLFDLLRAARDPETGAAFTPAALRDEVATMILAGHETTAVTLFWACWLAARLPRYAEGIAAEADGLDLSPENAAAAVKSLPATRAFIDETLRLYPPAYLIVRQALGPDTLYGHAIRAGTVVTIAPWVLHRHRTVWERPDSFDPTRFAPGAPPPPRYAYMPFGAGPRICVGAQFAITEAVLVLARLLRTYRLGFAGSGEVQPMGRVTTQPDRPVLFTLDRRG